MDIELRHKILSRIIIDPDTDCWLWDGSTNERNYGTINLQQEGRWVQLKVHIVTYEEWVGLVPRLPSGRRMDLDHACHNRDLTCKGGVTCWHRRCCNPSHVSPKTRRENLEGSTKSRSSIHAARTHCPYGHEYPTRSVPGQSRRCPTCHSYKESARQWNQRHPETPRAMTPPCQ